MLAGKVIVEVIVVPAIVMVLPGRVIVDVTIEPSLVSVIVVAAIVTVFVRVIVNTPKVIVLVWVSVDCGSVTNFIEVETLVRTTVLTCVIVGPLIVWVLVLVKVFGGNVLVIVCFDVIVILLVEVRCGKVVVTVNFWVAVLNCVVVLVTLYCC